MATIKYWNGSAWELAIVGKQGPAGPTGPTGPAGSASLQRFRFVATGGETSLSGTDANGNTLAYTAGLEEVFLNGAALVRGQDYIATNGTSITSLAALTATDVVEILAWGVFNVANTISNTLIDAKGDILAGSAADTVSRLAVGANDTVLTADSSTATGLKWATPTSGSLTLIASGSLSGSTVTISSIPQTYSDIRLYLFNWSTNNNGDLVWKINNTTANTYYYIASSNNATNYTGTSGSGIRLSSSITQSGYTSNMGCLEILNYTSTTAFKPIRGFSLNQQNGPYLESYYGGGAFADNTAVSSIVLDPESTNTFDNGTYALYGIK
jgi:hypothetical protein